MFNDRQILGSPKEQQSPAIFVGLLAALLLHALLLFLPVALFETPDLKSPQKEIVVERWVDPKEKRQTVQTSKAIEQADDEKEARFYGELKNRVEKETRAPIVGSFQEGHQQKPGQPEQDEDEDGIDIGMRELLPFGSQGSVLPDDVEIGSQTLLNTDPIRYGSFLNRVHDEVHGPWSRRVQDAVRTIGKLSEKVYITKLQVVVDRDGSVTSIRTLKSSGFSAIDNAAKKAFWDSEPFPNPPMDLDGEEQELSIGYEFHVFVQESSFLMVPWRL